MGFTGTSARSLNRRNEKLLRPIHANAGIEAAYRQKLERLVDEMAASLRYWLTASYRANEPEIAQDELSSAALKEAIRKLVRRWESRFDQAAGELAKYFAKSVSQRSDAALKKILKDGGFSIEFKMTRAQRDVLNAVIQENVSLIKSIPAQYLTQVEGIVMRGVQTGRDLSQITQDLQHQHGVTRRRAAFIALDQSNKATAALNRARQIEIGITEAVWVHSGGGKHPRPTHVKAGRERARYDVREGWFDPAVGKKILPGELPNCFPGSTRIEFADFVEVAYRRWYCGYLAEVVTDSGKTFRATLNHPVLTPRGWIAIGLLNKGDDLIEISEDGIAPIVSKLDANDAVPTLFEIFNSVSEIGCHRLEVSLRDQFHGDGTANGNVDIVTATRSLRFGRQSFVGEGCIKFDLAKTDVLLLGGGFTEEFQSRRPSTAPRNVRRCRKPLSPNISFAGHPEAAGIASSAQQAAGRDYTESDGFPVDLMDSGESQDAKPGLILRAKNTRVVNINYTAFEGHVFNLQTASGWYVAEGIVAHNCRCVSRSVIKGFS